MCVAIPGKVIEIRGKDSLIEFGRIKKVVNTVLIEDLSLGDYVLVHAGCAIEKVDEEEAVETLNIFKSFIEEL
ncbi:MAG: HypC/HybG/HupF family hydrogenase formation chaperone [Clostridium sp.]|uniref:HypC/HybG/HupF family hydrogenase formation chaperone n=1 Tax=Clostridium sp. TaxID=1506 RepID=UPI0030473136